MGDLNDPVLRKAIKLLSRIDDIGFIIGFDEKVRNEWVEKGISPEEIQKLLYFMEHIDEMTPNAREKEDVIFYWMEFVAEACRQCEFETICKLLEYYLARCYDKPLQNPFQLLSKIGRLECITLLAKYLEAEIPEVRREAWEAIYDILFNMAYEKGKSCSGDFKKLLEEYKIAGNTMVIEAIHKASEVFEKPQGYSQL